jgi:hypothetical protein
MSLSSTRLLLLLAAVAANVAQAQVGPQAELLPACIVRVSKQANPKPHPSWNPKTYMLFTCREIFSDNGQTEDNVR